MTMTKEQRARRAKLPALILQELERLGEPTTATRLAEAMGDFGRTTYVQILNELVNAGQVETCVRAGIQRYALRRGIDNDRLARTREVLYVGELRHYDTTLREFMKLCEGSPWR